MSSADHNDDGDDGSGAGFAGEFAVSEELVQSPTHKQAATGSMDFDGLLVTTPLKLHEDLSGGNGGQAWPAGRVLAKYLLRYKQEELRKALIVELGAGGGLVGLAVALGCHLEHGLHITDQSPMLALMQRNVELNGLQGRALPGVYDWGSPRPESIPRQPDIILAADCVYFEPAFPLLHETLLDLIGEQTVCYFCFKKRRRADMQFMRTAKKLFDVRDVTDDADQAVYARENIHLCEIRQKRGRE